MGIKILVVDDEKEVTHGIESYLNLEGYDVFTTNDPNKALEIIEENDIKVVISDIIMPEMNGVELLKKIKEFNNMIQVIMMTGFATNSQLTSCFDYGASECVLKPFNNLDEISKAVKEGVNKLERCDLPYWLDKMKDIKQYLVGIDEIDNQHIEICDFYTLLLRAKEKNNEEKEEDAVVKLLEHWKMHFKYEEDLMEQHEYFGFDEHKKEHDRIMNNFSNNEKIFSKGFKYVISYLVLNSNLWIEEHIKESRGEDKQLSKYLKNQGVA